MNGEPFERLGPYIAAGTPPSGEHFQSQL